ncbi:PIR Superfamily Protein [Plasmodium ovale curtisi]|uniref:PIR Superfamily Protein n=1 Tax=Plasmodium ovale curtisi TaxID=864141 RepID=A0A1A8XB94_PLAOA|nr:PIR Superfamily Protein [Plasmodium ovale curtisi]
MTNGEKAIISLECPFFDDSKVKTFYAEFLKICEDNSGIQKCLTETQYDSNDCTRVSNKLKELKSKFIEMLKSYRGALNVISSDRNVDNVNVQCICLKQLFYKQVLKEDNKSKNVYEVFRMCNREIKDIINDDPSNICTFRYLNFRGIERMKKIFDFYLFYYIKIKDFIGDEKYEQYLKHFKEGFYEHCNSIIECLNNMTNSEYFEEFKEYHYNYNALKVFFESLISYGKEAHGSDCDNGCVLAESLLKGQYLIELKEEIQKIRSGYRSTNSQTTAITVVSSVIGTVVGVFLISYYFFGITPSVIWSRIRKKKNKETHANVDDETESNSLFTSENLENNYKRKGYSISYKSTKYS